METAGERIARLNDFLRRELGEQMGRQRFRWMRSTDLVFPVRVGDETAQTDSGLFFVRNRYEQQPVLDGPPRWVLACLQDPGMDEAEWASQFGGQLEYPRSGYYFPTDIVCRPGAEPDEDVTAEACAAAKASLAANGDARWLREKIESNLAARSRSHEARIADEVENLVAAPDPASGRIITIGG